MRVPSTFVSIPRILVYETVRTELLKLYLGEESEYTLIPYNAPYVLEFNNEIVFPLYDPSEAEYIDPVLIVDPVLLKNP
jgi:hypothetical protein